MVKHTKGFKGLSKKVLSAILAASMIMTSSSFVMAAEQAPTEEPVVAEAQALDANDGTVGQAEAGLDDETKVVIVDENNNGYDNVDKDNSFTLPNETYADGEEINPEFTVKYGDTELTEGIDYNKSYTNNHVDSTVVSGEPVKIQIDFLDKYNALPQMFVYFSIDQVSINNSDTKVKEQYPEISSVTTKSGNRTYKLTAEDYDVVVNNGDDLINAGAKSVTIKAKGNFKDEYGVNNSYEIQQALIDGNVTVEANDIEFAANLTKETIEKNITVTDNFTGKALKAGEYVIEWYDAEKGTYDKENAPSTDIGTHNFRVRGTTSGNFSNESYEEGSYEIVKDGSLQMVINKVYKDAGYEMDEFVSDGSAWVATYNGEDLYKSPERIKAYITTNCLAENQFEIVENEAEWKNVGEYVVTVNGKNDYAGETATITFKINPKALNKSATEDSDDGVTVTAVQGKHPSGADGSVVVTVKDTVDGEEVYLVEGEDFTYTVEKSGNKSYAVITGIGNYTTAIDDTDVTTLKILVNKEEKLPLSDPSITAEVTGTYTFTGSEIRPNENAIKLVETDGSREKTLTVNDFDVVEYYDNTNAGEATILIKGAGKNYTGYRTVTFTIVGTSFEDTFKLADFDDFEKGDAWNGILRDIKVQWQNNNATYATLANPNGRIEFEITKDGKTVNTSGTATAEAGVYDVKITPTEGRYEGELTTTINVIGDDLKTSGAKIADIADQVYTSEAIEPDVVVTIGNKTLEEGKDYTVSYTDNVKGGEATAIVTGIGEYSGTIEKNFNITRAAQSIVMTNPLQEKDLANGSRTTKSNVCTLKLDTTMADEDTKYTYKSSDLSVATVNAGKITYQGVGECTITVSAAATDSCEAASLDITVKVGKPGQPTFTPSVTSKTAKKSITVTSSTVRGADGFEVQYSVRSDWWRASTVDFDGTNNKLYRQTIKTYHSNKKYYIRVRAYQVVDGAKVYSDWSPAKTATTK